MYCRPTKVLPAVVHPTKCCVNHNFENVIVPHVFPSHTTTVNHTNFQSQEHFPHSQSVVNEVSNTDIGPVPGPPPPPNVGGLGGFPGPYPGSVAGAFSGPGVGPGFGPGVGPGFGPGVGPGFGPGVGPGFGPGVGPGFGPGVGPGFGPGGKRPRPGCFR